MPPLSRSTAALVVGAGRGLRLGGAPKQYRALGPHAIIARALAPFLAHPRLGLVQCVIHPDDVGLYTAATAHISDPRLLPPVPGAATRPASVRAGLEALASHAPGFVLIHDAARPFVATDTLSRVLDALEKTPGAFPALPVTDALWHAPAGHAETSVARGALFRAQTPQGFHFAAILAAHRAYTGPAADDVAVARAAGLDVTLVEGDDSNVKITTAADLARAQRDHATMDIRTGNGFDVHAFTPGDAVTLCGVTLPHTHALKGHSDADVGLHALTDALFGALAEGDIGQWFPPSDPQWKAANSAIFLAKAIERTAARGYTPHPSRLHPDLRGPENRPPRPRHARPRRRPHRPRAGPRLDQGHHLRAPRLHRPGRGHRSTRHRNPGPRMTRVIATVAWIGLLRPAPGTWASAAAIPLAYALHVVGGFPLLALATGLLVPLAFWAIAGEIANAPRDGLHDDPAEIVIDEIIGQWIALWPVSAGLWFAGVAPTLFPWPGWVGAFVMFRLFDVWKPGPIGRADALHGARGVLADDCLAGVAAAICVAIAAAIAHGLLM